VNVSSGPIDALEETELIVTFVVDRDPTVRNSFDPGRRSRCVVIVLVVEVALSRTSGAIRFGIPNPLRP
jgi:hypothetical protein